MFLLQMVQDWRHWRDRQEWHRQDRRQEKGLGQATVWRVSKLHFLGMKKYKA